ncbi:MAG: type II and III secretion system protein [bacterium]|nr:type II and III secretion system protein [bacterium]
MAKTHPGLNNEVQLNVSSLPLAELVNSIAFENNLNISVDPNINQLISYNFYDAQVKDVLVFLYLNFEVEYEFVGSIISIEIRKEKVKPVVVEPPKPVDVKYNQANKFLSLNLKNDTLWKVTEAITQQSGINFVVDPEVREQAVNAYLLNRPSDQVLDMFAKSNNLLLIPEGDYFRLAKSDQPNPKQPTNNQPRAGSYQSNSKNGDFVLTTTDVGTIDVFARNVDLGTLVQAAAEETGVHYVLYSNLQGKVNMDMEDMRFDELIRTAFEGTPYSLKVQDDIYVMGESNTGTLRTTRLIRLENRTIESVQTAIPADLIAGVEVKEFEELNGLIVTGTRDQISILTEFISQIDVVVPMVQIDVMLLTTEKSSTVSTGITAGISDTPTETLGTVFPAPNLTLGSESINNILNAISGFGLVNLGQVTENFYVTLDAMESNNMLDIQSTPKISTLNGHEATISIGRTTYYEQVQVNVQTSVTQQGVLQSRQWQSIDANLSVSIKPFVSADEHVTLTITVEQDDFDGFIAEGAPPNIATQTFESMVRVKNGEMILLGGLEDKRRNDSGTGVPILSRIPALKWLFSGRTKSREKSKLHVLIRPVVTY